MVRFLQHWSQRSELPIGRLIAWSGLTRNRYYDWVKRLGRPNEHNAPIPKKHWLLNWEKEAIIKYATEHLEAGYRRITYLMLDENIVAVSPSTTYRVLHAAQLLGQPKFGPSKKGTGFEQPLKPHEHWHIDFSYLRLGSQFYFLVMVLDGCSRAILSWDINETMTEKDAEIVLQKAREKYPNQRPRIISDNGAQFLAKDFKEFIKICEMTHVTTSPYYPQSNGKLERANRTIKSECIRKQCPLDLEEAKRIAGRYITDYNEVRLHSAIGYITPKDRLEQRHEEIFSRRRIKMAEARKNRENEFAASQSPTKEKSFFSLEKNHITPQASREERSQEVPQPLTDDRREGVRTILDTERLDATATAEHAVI